MTNRHDICQDASDLFDLDMHAGRFWGRVKLHSSMDCICGPWRKGADNEEDGGSLCGRWRRRWKCRDARACAKPAQQQQPAIMPPVWILCCRSVFRKAGKHKDLANDTTDVCMGGDQLCWRAAAAARATEPLALKPINFLSLCLLFLWCMLCTMLAQHVFTCTALSVRCIPCQLSWADAVCCLLLIAQPAASPSKTKARGSLALLWRPAAGPAPSSLLLLILVSSGFRRDVNPKLNLGEKRLHQQSSLRDFPVIIHTFWTATHPYGKGKGGVTWCKQTTTIQVFGIG